VTRTIDGGGLAARLEVRDVTFAYGRRPVLDSLAFDLEPGVIGCLLGPSGCGKTTALRCVAGLERIHGGEIRLDDTTVSTPSAVVPVEQRRVGLVFQDYALFPHLTVAGNVAFGLHGWAAAARRERCREVLALVGLGEQADSLPGALSGGQQQRVALARALAPRPRLLLLDEPFSNLDLQLREHLSGEVARILRASGTTALLVTHDQQEAFAIADTVGVMHAGRLLQWASPEALYWTPACEFVARFIGEGVLLEGRCVDGAVLTALGRLPAAATGGGAALPDRARVLIRPEDVVVTGESAGAGPAGVPAVVADRRFRGGDVLLTLRLDDGAGVLARASSRERLGIGERVLAAWRGEQAVMFPSG
jgi:iron(III) transport system ATP-binding protein